MSVHKPKHLGPRVDLLSSRWRELLPSQRESVLRKLEFIEGKLVRLAERKRAAGEESALHHAANAGACRIARLFLVEIGGFPA